jgi:hypothetical protein
MVCRWKTAVILLSRKSFTQAAFQQFDLRHIPSYAKRLGRAPEIDSWHLINCRKFDEVTKRQKCGNWIMIYL